MRVDSVLPSSANSLRKAAVSTDTKSAWPAITSSRAGAEPRYETCVRKAPVLCSSVGGATTYICTRPMPITGAESREGFTLDLKRYRLAVSTHARSLSASKLSTGCARMNRVRLAPAAVAASGHHTAPEGLETLALS